MKHDFKSEGRMIKVDAELLTPTALVHLLQPDVPLHRSQMRSCFCPRCRRHYQGVPTVRRREPTVLHIPCTDCKHNAAYRLIDHEAET